jgi:hypothetical protein
LRKLLITARNIFNHLLISSSCIDEPSSSLPLFKTWFESVVGIRDFFLGGGKNNIKGNFREILMGRQNPLCENTTKMNLTEILMGG